MYKKLVYIIVVISMLYLCSLTSAQLFDPAVDNPSFEATDLGPGGTGQWVDYAEEWVINNQGNCYLEDGSWEIVAPDGVATLKMWSGAAIWQQIGTWNRNTDYEISLWVGRGHNSSAFQVELWAGGNPALVPESGFGTIENTVGATLIVGAPLIPTVATGESEWMTLILNTGTEFNAGDALWLRIESIAISGEATWIDNVMVTPVRDPVMAYNPNPSNSSTEVPRDVVLNWTPGMFALSHDIYFGTNPDDVTNATRTEPLDVLIIEDHDVNNYDIGRLDFDQTYYWRIDEINAPPDAFIYNGDIWSFTIEPLAYPVPSEMITATASSQSEGQEPEKTIDGSGLDGDLHSTELTSMWFSQESEPGMTWIQYEFNKTFKLHEMLVWNYNGQTINTLYGIIDATVEYSTDGTNWTQLENVPQFAQASGEAGYTPNTIVEFNDVAAKYVRITANNNHAGGMGFFNRYGLSEVRFMYIPVSAKNPNPGVGATNVSVDSSLGWKAGREAAEHNVYISTDQQAVTDGTATMITINQTSYTPQLGLGSTYYWRIDEVNTTETPTTWAGDIWSFSTQEYIIVDDFESYNDIPEGQEESRLVYIIWADGVGNNANGSTMGYFTGSSIETDNVHGGGQSVPFFYNNTSASLSEVTVNTSDLSIGRNWSTGSPQALVLWIHGDLANAATDQLYAKIGSTKVVYDGDITKPLWVPWSIDLTGVNLNNVPSVTIGLERISGAGGTGVIFLDDIRLYGTAPTGPSEQLWIEAEAADSIEAPMMTFDDPNASGGQYIMKDPDAAASTGSPPSDGLVTYTFTVEGGVYTIAGRVITNGSNDSFWVRIPDATMNVIGDPSNPGWIEWNNMTQENVWGWENVFSSNNDNVTVEFTMPAGTYTMEIRYREDESQLDALVITSID